jgi:hypothetical protein
LFEGKRSKTVARHIAVSVLAAASLILPSVVFAQAAPSVPVCHKAPVCVKGGGAAPAPAPGNDGRILGINLPPNGEVPPDGLDKNTQFERLGGVIMVGAGAYFITDGVRKLSYDAAHVSKVGKLPVYGDLARSIPWIGTAAAKVPIIPTTLGQAPFLGPLVHGVPLVGPVIAGPPNPIIVGAVALDTYLIPRAQPCGYTESSQFTMTDFNSPPRLRSYVNYLAPQPYTHPPIYAGSTLNTGEVPYADTASAAAGVIQTVNIPN